MNPTPACPKGLTEYECEVEGVDLVCYLEYTPEEFGSRDSNGLPNEPDYPEQYVITKVTLQNSNIDLSSYISEDILFDMEDRAKAMWEIEDEYI